MTHRRHLLAGLGAMSAGLSLPRIAFASAPTEKRLVVIVLRGAMDGLSAMPAHGDPDYERARTGLAISPPGTEGGALHLNGFFGLNPALSGLKARYDRDELIAFHAIASPYRERSHFDGQNLLESGGVQPYALSNGWLNRALAGLPADARQGRRQLGVALAPAMPLMLRGDAAVTSWSPSVLPGPGPDLVARLRKLYSEVDPKLRAALDGAVGANISPAEPGNGYDPFVGLMRAAARFLTDPDGPRVAMVESSGWDTHANQVGPYGVLSRNFAALDKGVEALASGLGPAWSESAVLIITEFGRTVAMNGTAGSDHGTASAAFLVGGAVAGGRVVSDWPGLKSANLYLGRDLRPTMDLRAVMKAVLQDHLGLSRDYIARSVFPQSQDLAPIPGLFRA